MKRLILFGSKMGLNFSGGSNATVRLFQHMVEEFDEVFVVAQEFGPLHFPCSHNTIEWQDETDAYTILQELLIEGCIYYGDFWDSIYFVKANIPFFFTYHDNWPEQKYLSLKNWYLSFQREACYKKIFTCASHVFSVTQHKRKYIARFTENHSWVPNGSCMKPSKFSQLVYHPGSVFKIIMVGNLDARKYKYALALFSNLDHDFAKRIQVDIYGHLLDPGLSQKLSKFSFINLKGFRECIDYSPYHLFLSCSQSENLPISMLESLINYTPILSFDIGGISELVKQNHEGILVKPYNLTQMKHILTGIQANRYSFSFNHDKLQKYNWRKSADLMLNRFRSDIRT